MVAVVELGAGAVWPLATVNTEFSPTAPPAQRGRRVCAPGSLAARPGPSFFTAPWRGRAGLRGYGYAISNESAAEFTGQFLARTR